MPKNVIRYDLLISCPGDIETEIDTVKKVVDQFNQLYSDPLGITIRYRHWSTSSYAQSGDKPQELLNKQIVKDCDAAIAIFWTRFGTATDRYDSGTEEEIEILLENKKQVFVYFSDKPINPSSLNSKQYKKVNAFKERYKSKGLYQTFSSDEELQKMFFAHLSQHFLSLPKIAELEASLKPALRIKSIREEASCEDAYVSRFTVNGSKDAGSMKGEISRLFSEVSENKLGLYSGTGSSFLGYARKPVKLGDDIKEYIRAYAADAGISVNEEFFNLGDLCEKPFHMANFYTGGAGYEGDDMERKKYNDLLALKNAISDYLHSKMVNMSFSDLYCIRFLLVNEGTAHDKNIDIELEFEPSMILRHEHIPIPDDFSVEYILDELSVAQIFEIERTSEFMDYDSSRTENHIQPYYPGMVNPVFPDSYIERYKESLNDLFEYEYYWSGSVCKIKLHIDYIKQHTAVAFPTPIFVNKDRSDIRYTIISECNPEVVTGSLRVIAS